MKKVSIAALLFAMILSGQVLFAHPRGYGGLTPPEILAAIPDGAGKTADDLTVAEWTALLGAASIAKQEDRYVGRAQFLSFVLPGTGQFMTGNYGGGMLRLGAELAIIGGTAAAYWMLLPSDLQDSSLSRSERRSIREDYWDSGDGAKLLPAMGVAAAGLTLSIVNRVLASSDAGDAARANIQSGKVSFEPNIYLSGTRLGLGLKMRIY